MKRPGVEVYVYHINFDLYLPTQKERANISISC